MNVNCQILQFASSLKFSMLWIFWISSLLACLAPFLISIASKPWQSLAIQPSSTLWIHWIYSLSILSFSLFFQLFQSLGSFLQFNLRCFLPLLSFSFPINKFLFQLLGNSFFYFDGQFFFQLWYYSFSYLHCRFFSVLLQGSLRSSLKNRVRTSTISKQSYLSMPISSHNSFKSFIY